MPHGTPRQVGSLWASAEGRPLLGSIVEHAPIGVLVVRSDGRLVHANQAASQLLGLDANRRLAAHRSDLFGLGPQVAAVLEGRAAENAAPQHPGDPVNTRRVTRVLRADGQSLWIEFSIAQVTQVDTQPLAVVFLSDLTRQYQLEGLLRAKGAGLDLVLSRAPIAIALTDAALRARLWNAGCEGLFGIDSTQALHQGLPELTGVPEADLTELVGQVARGSVVRDAELPYRSAAGTVGTLRLSVAATDASGEPGYVWLWRDVSADAQARADLRASESRLRKILQHINDTVTIVDALGRPAATSTAVNASPVLGYGADQWADLNVFDLLHPDDYDWAGNALQHLLAAPGNAISGRVRIRDAAGVYQEAEGWGVNLLDDPDVAGIVLTTRNVTDRVRNERLIEGQAAVLGLVAEGAPLDDALVRLVSFVNELLPGCCSAVVLVGPDGGALRAVSDGELPARLAQAAAAALGALGDGQVVVDDVEDLASFAEVTDGLDRIGRRGLVGQPVRSSASGQPVALVVVARPGAGRLDNHEQKVLAVAADLAAVAIDREHTEQRLAHQALHDSLTGLANRHLLLDRLELALARAQRRGRKIALMFLDLDHFKVINDSLGHDAGDEVLRLLGERLRLEVRPEDTVARFGGDEFVVLVEHVVDEHHVNLIAERLERCLEQPFVVHGQELYVTASIGIVIAKGGDEAAATLLRNADTAMYRAKELGRNRLEVFDEQLRAELVDRLSLESDLRHAVARGELDVVYQPIIQLSGGQISMVEALLRWRHPQRGTLTPDAFLALAEDNGVLNDMGWWLVDTAAAALAQWPQQTAGPVGLTVNLSPRQAAQPDLAQRLFDVLDRHGIERRRLVVEITETALLDDSETVSANLANLRAGGVRLAIDDFGTGVSSLSCLHRVPVELLKIDRAFIAALASPQERQTRRPIVAALVSMSKALGIQVVAEGVEYPEQVDELIALGCDFAQGYAFSEPLVAAGLAELLGREVPA